MTKIVCISDTHNLYEDVVVPECDILIHAGDWTGRGLQEEVADFCNWLDKQPAKHIICIPGNHEKFFERQMPDRSWFISKKAHLLIDESIEIEGIKIYGSPWTPYFHNWAWNAGRTPVEAAHTFKPFIGDIWAKIPDDTELLITHGPPQGILDSFFDTRLQRLNHVGCSELFKRIKKLHNLKYHVFGHIHDSGGRIEVVDNVTYINAAICDEQYQPTNKLIILNI